MKLSLALLDPLLARRPGSLARAVAAPVRLGPPAGLSSLVLAALLAGPAAAQQPSAVRVEAVRMEEVQDLRRVTGEARAVQRSLVAAQEEGAVLEVLVREGAAVEAGAPLARLDGRRLELEHAVLEAQRLLVEATLAERRADAERASRDLGILKDLAQRDAVNPKELSDAESEELVARARVLQAEQDLAVLAARRDLLLDRIADLEPKAPFAGVVVARHAEAGEWVQAGDPLVELVSAERLEAWLEVPQGFYAALAAYAGPLPITLFEGAEPLEVGEWRIVPSIDRRGRSFPLVADLPAGSGAAPGMSLQASIPTGARSEQLTVPRGAILRSETGPYVYVAQAGGEGAPPTAALVPIEVLFPAGAWMAVRSPRLAPGDLVVVEGNERLYPSAPLQPRTVDSR